MDNRTIDFVSEGHEALKTALQLMWDSAPGGKATHYRVLKLAPKTRYYGIPDKISHYTEMKVDEENGVETLVLYWSDDKTADKLPFPLTKDNVADFVQGWLDNSADYGEEPDIDGSCGKGFRVFTEQWGHVAGSHYSIVAVQPNWSMYGK